MSATVTIPRRELEAMAAVDEPEGRLDGLHIMVTPKLLLLLCEWSEQRGTRIEVISLYPGSLADVELRFFRADL